MKIPIIKYSDKFLNSISLFMDIAGITLFPFIILREKYRDNKYLKTTKLRVINHESIHTAQQLELFIIGFYILYLFEWLVRLTMKGNAYKNISFEKEAKANEDNLEYLKTRKWYSFFSYL